MLYHIKEVVDDVFDSQMNVNTLVVYSSSLTNYKILNLISSIIIAEYNSNRKNYTTRYIYKIYYIKLFGYAHWGWQ